MTESPIDLTLPDLAPRIAFLFPGYHGDPTDPDDLRRLDDELPRLELITAEHAGLVDHEPLEDDRQRFHDAMHLVVANQVLAGNPAPVWPTLQRIVARGYPRHEALHMVGAGVAEVIWYTMKGIPWSPEEYLRYLAGLPEKSAWARPGPTLRRGGGAAKRHPKRRH